MTPKTTLPRVWCLGKGALLTPIGSFVSMSLELMSLQVKIVNGKHWLLVKGLIMVTDYLEHILLEICCFFGTTILKPPQPGTWLILFYNEL